MAQYSPTVQNLLNRIDGLQAQIEAMKPISPEQIKKVFQKYRLDWNYNSNSIEGNSLNYGETVAFIMEGLTAKGKPLKDHLDIKGHNDAINFLLAMQEQSAELMERDIRSLHEMILIEPYQSKAQTADGQDTTKTIHLGVYKTSPNHVVTRTGEIHYYATPEETPAMMHELMEWYRVSKPTMHPLVLSALFHHRFVNIHPFDDGNGRMSRLLSNLILMQADFPPVVVLKSQKTAYYGVLSQADAGITDPLLEFFADLLIHSLETYLKAARGEDFSDPDDLDKQVALFIAEFDEEALTRERMSRALIEKFFDESLVPLVYKINSYCSRIDTLFHEAVLRGRKEERDNGKGTDYEDFFPDELDHWLSPTEGLLRNQFVEDFYDEEQALIRTFVLTYSWDNFKAKPNIGSFDISIGVIFDNFECVVYLSGDRESERVIKYYPRQLNRQEIDSITSRAMHRLMNEISSRSASASGASS